jgi:hypothetical protein
MQLTPRYLVSNRTIVISNEVGFVTEYRPVYQRELQVYRGIDNVLDFQILNADQKPVHLGERVVKFVAFDESSHLIIEHDAETVIANKGLVKVTVTDNDLINIQQQYLRYNLYICNVDDSRTLTYADEHFDANGIIYLSSRAYPGPKKALELKTFNSLNFDDDIFISEAISAEPGINGNEAVHTAAIYTNGYVGDVILEATLENQIPGQDIVEWTVVDTITFDGTEVDPVPVNFVGIYTYIRFKAENNPADTIEKILIRN